jgi:hypothetical protein
LLKLLKLAASIDFDPRQSGNAMEFTANAIIASAVNKTVRMVTHVPDRMQGWR